MEKALKKARRNGPMIIAGIFNIKIGERLTGYFEGLSDRRILMKTITNSQNLLTNRKC